MTLTYRGNGAWGAGKGSALTQAEFDGNTYTLHLRIQSLEDNPPEPYQLENILVSGGQISFVWGDGTTYGPFTMPRQNFIPAQTEELDPATDGTYEIQSSDANKYKRYLGSSAATVLISSDMVVDSEIYFKRKGTGTLSFDWATDVTVNLPDGFLPQVAAGGTVILKCVGANEFDIDGRLIADV